MSALVNQSINHPIANPLAPLAAADPAAQAEVLERIVSASLAGLSWHSCRVYKPHLEAFLAYLSRTNASLSRESVERYLKRIPETSSRNQALSAIKRLAEQAAQHSWLTWDVAFQVSTIKSKRLLGVRAGNWLSLAQSISLMASPDPARLSGKRDRAILALLLGTGIRRDELARLQHNQIQVRDGRTYILDLLGKGNRLRTVAIPDWALPTIQAWLHAAAIDAGAVIRSIHVNGRIHGTISTSGIWNIVTQHAQSVGLTCSPHDLRRTYAKLSRKGKAPLDVIQRALGHASVATTERYTNAGEEANAGDYFAL